MALRKTIKRKPRCPVCRKRIDGPEKIQGKLHFPVYFPFCSEKCKLIDLGRWFDQDYHISDTLLSFDEEEFEDLEGGDT